MAKKSNVTRSLHRLKIIVGQLEGMIAMLEQKKPLMDIVKLSVSIQQAMKGIDTLLLEDYLTKQGKSKKKTQELVSLYKLHRK
jgi:DNA-binding FrmR family transcriptional regulator